MAVHIDEVEVAVDDQAAERASGAAPAGSQSGQSDPALALAIDRAIALLRSRDLRLRAD